MTLDTVTADLFAFNFSNSEGGVDLDTNLDGKALLNGLNSAPGSASLYTSRKGGSGYIAAYDNDNAYLYRFAAGSDQSVIASEIALLAIFDHNDPINPGALDSSNFTLL